MSRKRSPIYSNPQSRNLFERPRLLEQLQTLERNCAAVWISSPAGAGKTALAGSYIDRLSLDSVWIRLQECDADPGVFLHSIQQAVNTFAPRRVQFPPLEPFSNPSHYFDAALEKLVAALPEETIFVWDNCECLANAPEQLAALARLLDSTQQPDSTPQQRCRHYFLSRLMLPPTFSRLQVDRRVATLDWQELKLDREEFATAYRVLSGEPPPPGQIDTWFQLTDGWFAALVLLLANDATGVDSTAASSAAIFDYLASEVLSGLSEPHQNLLQSLSLLPYLSQSLVVAVAGKQSAFSDLQTLSRHIRLIETSAGPTPVYRLHPLLKEFLQQRLIKNGNGKGDDSEHRRLRERTADALITAGDIEAAGELLCSNGSWNSLSKLIEAQAGELINSGRGGILEQWLAGIPREYLTQKPWLRYWQAMCSRFEQPALAWPMLETLFHEFRRAGDVVGQYTVWLSLVEAILVVFEDLKPLQHWLREYHALRDRHPRCPDLVLRLKTITLAGSVMSVIDPKHPKLRRLIRLSEIGVRIIPFKVPRQALFMYLILHYANTGQVASMHAMARHLLPALNETALPGALRVFAYSMIGLHEMMTGEEDLEKTLDAALDLAPRVSGGIYTSMPRCYQVYVALVEGRIELARERYADYQNGLPENQRMHQAAHDFLGAWMSAVEGATGRALELSRQSKAMCTQLYFEFGLALNSNLRAQLFSQQGEFERARGELQQLQQLAETSGSRLLQVMHAFGSAWLALNENGESGCLEMLRTAAEEADVEGILAFPGFLRPVMAELAQAALNHGVKPAYFERLVLRWQLVPCRPTPSATNWPWTARIYTLGRFEVYLRGERIDFSSAQRRPLQLLAALIAQGGSDVPKSALCDTLWRDSDADKAAHALDNLLHRLRKMLGRELLQVNSGYVSLHPDLCWVDSWALRALPPGGDTATLLTGIYTGTFLPAEDGAWAIPERETLRRLFLRNVRRCLDELSARGNMEQAIDLLEHACHVEPTAEDPYLWLMELYSQQQQSAEAIRVYQRCAFVLNNELGVQPRPELTDYYKLLKT